MKYLGAITADKDLTTKEYVDAGDAAFQAKRSQLVRPNLLDNWYFVGGGSQQGGGQFPINQRRVTSWSSMSYTYCIDRWRSHVPSSGTTINGSLSESGLTISFSGTSDNHWVLEQLMEDGSGLIGRKVTMSILYSNLQDEEETARIRLIMRQQSTDSVNHQIYSDWSTEGDGLLTVTGTVHENVLPTGMWFAIALGTKSPSVNLIAAKLELGDTQTLAHQENGSWVLNEIPNYQEQLFRCQTSTADSADTYANKPNLVGFQVNPNLLDNWYFVGGGSQQGGGQFPINQRGSATYAPSSARYTIDRWYLRIYNGATVLSCDADGLTITTGGQGFQGIMQSIENGKASLAGKTVTLSALVTQNTTDNNAYLSLTNGSSASAAGTYLLMQPIAGTGLITGTVTVPASLSNNYVNVVMSINASAGRKLSVVAAKLELGDTQTLAHQENGAWVLNEIPNYQKQLKRCQRFFIAFNHAGQSYCKPGNGYAKSGTAGLVLLPHPTMRAAPSVTYSGSWAMKDYSNNYCTVSAMSRDVATAVGTSLNITSSSMTSGREYTLTANNDSTANIYLSADL